MNFVCPTFRFNGCSHSPALFPLYSQLLFPSRVLFWREPQSSPHFNINIIGKGSLVIFNITTLPFYYVETFTGHVSRKNLGYLYGRKARRCKEHKQTEDSKILGLMTVVSWTKMGSLSKRIMWMKWLFDLIQLFRQLLWVTWSGWDMRRQMSVCPSWMKDTWILNQYRVF